MGLVSKGIGAWSTVGVSQGNSSNEGCACNLHVYRGSAKAFELRKRILIVTAPYYDKTEVTVFQTCFFERSISNSNQGHHLNKPAQGAQAGIIHEKPRIDLDVDSGVHGLEQP